MAEPMSDVDFLRSMFMSFVKNREEAKKLMRADPAFEGLSDDCIDKIVRKHYPEGKWEFGYADLALAAIRTGKIDTFNEVFVVDAARKKIQEKYDRFVETPLLKAELDNILSEAAQCKDDEKKQKLTEKIDRLHEKLSKRKNRFVNWENFFAAGSYADKAHIVQILYHIYLTPAEIFEFLYIGEDDKSMVMQEIYREEKERIAAYGEDDFYEAVNESLLCEDEILKEILEERVIEIEMERIRREKVK